jgi:hypothetical protein
MPGVHQEQLTVEIAPTREENVPSGHAIGEMLPAGQKEPAGHMLPVTLSVGESNDAPPKQENPARHTPVGALRPDTPQTSPAGQIAHPETFCRPVRLPNVPAGHGCGTAVPAGQKLPAGHTLAFAPCDGDTVRAPRTQKYPAPHGPVGSVSPTLAQYIPALQSLHWLAACSSVRLLYVPIGHGLWCACAVPFAQKCPAGQGNSDASTTALGPLLSHTYPAGQPTHTDWPVFGWYCPDTHRTGAIDPVGQKNPAGHAKLAGAAVAWPAGQWYPPTHRPVGAVSPNPAQYQPAVHDRQSKIDAASV